jgi:putative ABC transport system substrate-binding protein
LLIVYPQPFTAAQIDAIVAAAVRHRLPLISGTGGAIIRSGGLMAYWIDPVALFAQAASYIDRILKGASAADLPVRNRRNTL